MENIEIIKIIISAMGSLGSILIAFSIGKCPQKFMKIWDKKGREYEPAVVLSSRLFSLGLFLIVASFLSQTAIQIIEYLKK